MKPRWKAQLGGSSFTKTEAAQVVQREETQLKQNCKKTNIRTPEGRPEGVEMKDRTEMNSMATDVLECKPWPLLKFLSLPMCAANGI